MIVNSEEETDNGMMEFRRKRRADRIETFAIMITTPYSPSVSSQTIAQKSSPIAARSNPCSPCISLICLPPAKMLPIKESSDLAPSHQNLSSMELKGSVKRWKNVAKRKICDGHSSRSSQKYALLTLSSFLQAFFAEASEISLGLKENIVGVEATHRELKKNLKSTQER